MNSPPGRGAQPASGQPAGAPKEVVEQPSAGAAAATPRSPEPPEAPPESEHAPATPVESYRNLGFFYESKQLLNMLEFFNPDLFDLTLESTREYMACPYVHGILHYTKI